MEELGGENDVLEDVHPAFAEARAPAPPPRARVVVEQQARPQPSAEVSRENPECDYCSDTRALGRPCTTQGCARKVHHMCWVQVYPPEQEDEYMETVFCREHQPAF